MGTLNLLEFAKNRQIQVFFSCLHSLRQSNKIIDENKINPRHIYASAKAAAEICVTFILINITLLQIF